MSLLKSIFLSSHVSWMHQPGYTIRFKSIVASMVGAVAIASVAAMPSMAADPFRPAASASNIDEQTEQAFYEMFRDGDYQAARQRLAASNPSDPLAYAMSAAFSYLDNDLVTLNTRAEQTLTAARQLETSDPLRSHLYKAVGHFMEGAYIFESETGLTKIPKTLAKLNDVLSNMRAAERIDETDPELNLLKGFMDLQIAVALPRSNPEDAIRQLETYGAPDYLVNRGIAIAYRDLEQYNNALDYVNAAIEDTAIAAPSVNNPDLQYLRGQILRNQSDDLEGEASQVALKQSISNFKQAFNRRGQMPDELALDLGYELCRARFKRDSPDASAAQNNANKDRCKDWSAQKVANPADTASQ
ncbi:MAG: Sll0314/Alr1548 family TPR repeat-containing protein [Cyanobacteria bacterium P01_F01_bin.150]